MKKLAIAMSLAAGLVLQPIAFAGTASVYGVTVSQYGANGPVKAARNSANNQEFIGCAVYGTIPAQSSYTTYVACSARDASGKSFYCATYGAAYQLVQAALAVSESSSIIINADSSYHCTYIYVANYSMNL
jgi:hypothetical protein